MASSYRLLVVDDSEAIHRDFQKLLERDDASDQLDALAADLFEDLDEDEDSSEHPVYDIEFALQGREAYQLVKERAAEDRRFALAFVDVRMPPGWDGVETIQKLWEVDPDIEIVMCSAHSDYPWATLLKELGTTDQFLFLRKPFDGIAVKQMTLALTKKWGLAREKQQYVGTLERAVARRTVELENAMAALKNKNEELQRASEAKSQFLANMSHEIRTPLNGVVGTTQLLTDTSLTAEQQHFVDVIVTSSHGLLSVVDDILDFSKIEAGKLTLETVDFDVRKLIDETLTILASKAAERGIELAARIEPDVPELLAADPVRLRQVLLNLTGNALKFTETGYVLITARRKTLGRRSHVRFAVTDTGIGIPQEAQVQLFEAFEQADVSTTRRYGGTGLGLAISRRIVELMGGTIGVDSQENVGSTFWFTVRTVQPERQAPRVPPTRALLVSSAGQNCTTLDRYLREFGSASIVVDPGAMRAELEAGSEFDAILVEEKFIEACSQDISRYSGSAKTVCILDSGSRASSQSLDELGFEASLRLPIQHAQVGRMVMALSDPGEQAQPEELTNDEQQQFPGRVLVVEDHPVNQMVATAMLAKLGSQTRTAANGLEALEALGESDFDLVLMDVHMPEMDGVEATKAIRAREGASETGKRTPIIALTASVLPEEIARCTQAGMDGFLSKPISKDKLQSELSRWLQAATENAA